MVITAQILILNCFCCLTSSHFLYFLSFLLLFFSRGSIHCRKRSREGACHLCPLSAVSIEVQLHIQCSYYSPFTCMFKCVPSLCSVLLSLCNNIFTPPFLRFLRKIKRETTFPCRCCFIVSLLIMYV